MKQTKVRFLSSVFVLCLFGMVDAFAAPSVKMLGTNTARIGLNTTAVKSTANTNVSSQPQQRLGSIRANNLAGGKPVTLNTTTAPSSDESRISLSNGLSNATLNKYLHSPSSNNAATKPVTPSDPSITDQDFTALTDRVQDLETGIENKQDNLYFDESVFTSENNEVYLKEEYLQLPGRIDDLEDEIDSKVTMGDVNNVLTNNYYTQWQVQSLLNNQVGVDTKRIYDYRTGDRAWVTVTDMFDPVIFEQ